MLLIDTGDYSRLKNHETPNNSFKALEKRIEEISQNSMDIDKNLLLVEKHENTVYHNISEYHEGAIKFF